MHYIIYDIQWLKILINEKNLVINYTIFKILIRHPLPMNIHSTKIKNINDILKCTQ